MGLLTGNRPKLGVTAEGSLQPVDDKPQNSVSSQTSIEANKIAPLATGDDPQRAFQVLGNLLETFKGSSILEKTDTYIRAEFETPTLRFVDDVEFLLAADQQKIHVRSASRLGRKDFGVNRKRIEAIRSELAETVGV